jgi:hypothetical protein
MAERYAQQAVHQRLKDELNKASKKEAEGTPEAEHQARRMRAVAEKKHYEDFTRIVEYGQAAMRGRGFGTVYKRRGKSGRLLSK